MKKTLTVLAVAGLAAGACQNATESPPTETTILNENFEGERFPPAGWQTEALGKESRVRIYRNAEGENHFATLAVEGLRGSAEGYLTAPALRREGGAGFDVSFRYRRGMDGENEYARAKVYDPQGGGSLSRDLPYADDWVDERLPLDAAGYDAALYFYVEVVEEGDIALDVDDVKVEITFIER